MLFFRNKRKLLISLGFLLVIIVCVSHLINQQSWIRTLAIFQRSLKTPFLHWKTGACEPAKNIAYLKTHKCSSSTFQNILFRYGLKHDLVFAMPETGSYFGRFIPFHAAMVPKRLKNNFELNILALHTIWNHKEVKSVMPSDTVYFTSIREPSSLFESLYSYAMENGTTLEDYIRKTEITDKRMNGHIGYNQMCFDFGFDQKKIHNFAYLDKKITEADRNFDLVLVTERMDESLILLKHLLCWSVEDVVAIKLNSRKDKFRTKMNGTTRKLLEMRQTPDRILYEHFFKKFDNLVQEFGEEQMAREVQELREATEKMKKDCGFKELGFHELRGRNKVFSEKVSGFISDSKNHDCLNTASSELFLIDRIRRQQRLMLHRKIGRKSFSLLEDLPLGAVALYDKKNLKETSEVLKKYMMHS